MVVFKTNLAVPGLAIFSTVSARPDHVPAGTMAAGYGTFGPSGSWDSSYQDSLAQIQQAYDSMNNMFGSSAEDGGYNAYSAPESAFAAPDTLTPFNPYTNAEANPYGANPYAPNAAAEAFNPLDQGAFANPAAEQPAGYNTYNSGPNFGDAYGSVPNTYGADPNGAYGSYNPPNLYGGNAAMPPNAGMPPNAAMPPNNQGSYNPYNAYNQQAPPQQAPGPGGYGSNYPSQGPGQDAENSANYGGYGNGMSIDQQLQPDIQEDCWQNITDRINGFFGDRFPTLPNGQSAYTDIEILNCYGCWCNREERFGNGMGEPRDAFDAICKFHHQAYECIEIDAEERGEVCDPTETSAEGFRFKMELSFDQGRGGMNLQCDQNQSWCKQRVCEADLQYIKDFVRTALAGHRVRRDIFGHEDHIGSDGLPTGYFQQTLECPLGGSLHTPHKKCCGAYPRRRVFKTDTLEDGDSSFRQCCDLENGDNTGATDGAVYYPSYQVCCNEHGVQNGNACELYNAL